MKKALDAAVPVIKNWPKGVLNSSEFLRITSIVLKKDIMISIFLGNSSFSPVKIFFNCQLYPVCLLTFAYSNGHSIKALNAPADKPATTVRYSRPPKPRT